VVDIGGEDGAAIFDLRNKGFSAGFRNAFWLRSSVSLAMQNKPLTLVFDNLSWRERFISAGTHAVAIPSNQSNIYLAYEFFLKSLFPILPASSLGPVTGKLVGIFPITSLNKKNLTTTVINQITSICRSRGFNPAVFLLDGERLEGAVSAPIVKIDKNFTTLLNVIDSLAGSICADSLSAHLSAYLNKRVFVVTPAPNTYWLPESVYVNDFWGVFKEVDALDRSLERFLSSLGNDFRLSEKLNIN
jgi:ADP-heptose:LPS heptosyltransferase